MAFEQSFSLIGPQTHAFLICCQEIGYMGLLPTVMISLLYRYNLSPMGHIAHLGNISMQWSSNTMIMHARLLKVASVSPWHGSYLNSLNSLHPECPVVLRKVFFSHQCINDSEPLGYYSLIEKIVTLHLRKLESLSLKEALCQVWFIDCFMFYAVSALYLPSNSGKLGRYCTSGSGEDWKSRQYHFHYAAVISHWKKLWSFIWSNFNPFIPKMLYTKFDWNWPYCSGRDEEMKTDRRMRSEKLTSWAHSSGELTSLRSLCFYRAVQK